MSIPHHNPQNEEEMRKMLTEIFGESQRRWPHGRISGDDDGQTRFAIATDIKNQIVRIQFTQPMAWLGLDLPACRQLEKLLKEKGDELERAMTPIK